MGVAIESRCNFRAWPLNPTPPPKLQWLAPTLQLAFIKYNDISSELNGCVLFISITTLRLISIHQFLARALLFPSDILQSHGAYQITLQLHLRKTRASKYSHLLPTRNVFSGGKANSPPALKANIAAVTVRVASGFCCRNILIFLKVEGRN